MVFNIAILLLNWGSINPADEGSESVDAQQGQILTLANAEQLPIVARSQPGPPPAPPTPTARFIDQALDFFSEAWRLFREMIAPSDRNLPGESAPPPVEQAPAPPEPKIAAYCLDIGSYASSQRALSFQEALAARGISSELRREEVAPPASGKFIVVTRVRASLDTAKELSDHLAGNGIPNRIEENRPLGYLLQSSVFGSRSAAQRALKKIERLGMSAYMQQVDAADSKPASTLYYLRLDKPSVTLWNQINELEGLQRLAGEEVRFQQVDSC